MEAGLMLPFTDFDLTMAMINSRQYEDRRPFAIYCGAQFDGKRYCVLTDGHRDEHQDVPYDEAETLFGDTDAMILAAQAHARRRHEEARK